VKLLADTQKKHAAEEMTVAAIAEGQPTGGAWIDTSLQRLGCETRE